MGLVNNRLTAAALILLAMLLAVMSSLPAVAQEPGGCDGIVVGAETVEISQIEQQHAVGVSFTLFNNTPFAIYDAWVQMEFFTPGFEYSPVTHKETVIPARDSVDVSLIELFRTLPEEYDVTVVACRYELPELFSALHSDDAPYQEAAIAAFERMTAADVPALLEALQQRSAGDPLRALPELIEDVVLIGTLARLGDPQALGPLMDALAIYQTPPFQSAYPELITAASVLPASYMSLGRELGPGPEHIPAGAIVALTAAADPELEEETAALLKQALEQRYDVVDVRALLQEIYMARAVLIQEEELTRAVGLFELANQLGENEIVASRLTAIHLEQGREALAVRDWPAVEHQYRQAHTLSPDEAEVSAAIQEVVVRRNLPYLAAGLVVLLGSVALFAIPRPADKIEGWR